MIRFFQVYKTYPGQILALSDINFNIDEGEFVFLTGPSGAGKTTLLKLIIRAERPDRGEILVNGRNVARLKYSQIAPLRREVGFVFQDFKLLHHRSVAANIGLALEVVGYNPKQIPKRIRHVLRLVGLNETVTNQLPHKLSGGEQQRVAIARAIVNAPPILLADEPTGNLDPDLTVEIMDLLQRINELGTTILVATHNTSLVSRYRKRVLRIQQGGLMS